MEQPRLTRSTSFSELPRIGDALERPAVGRLQRANSMDDVRIVTPLSLPTPARQEIGTALGIRDRDLKDNGITGKGPLSAGQELLNKEFSRWEMSSASASKSFDWNSNMLSTAVKSIGCFFKSIHTFIWSGAQLVSEAKASQELLKNPVIATEAIAYLAGLRAKGVTVDLTQYRDSKLDKAQGEDLAVGLARGGEETFMQATVALEARLPEKYRRKLEGSGDIFATRQVAISDLQDAMNAISKLAPSFDAQRQMVAAVTHNIAMQAGIIDEAGKVTDQPAMDFLVDQMSSLWIQSAPVGDNTTPFAVTKFADKIAQSFDAAKPDSFAAIYNDVHQHAQIFAEALMTEKPGEEEDAATYMEAVEGRATEFEVQIWDSLKANTTFTSKMTAAVKGITTEHTRLHDYALTTDVVAKTVVDSFQDISASNRGNQSGEEFFNMQLASLGTRMPNEMFNILNGFTAEEVSEGKHEMSLARLHEIDPSLAREGGSMSASELLTAMDITETETGSNVTFNEAGGNIYDVLARHEITEDEAGKAITGVWNKKFTPETLAATLNNAGWHQTEVERFVSNFNPDTRLVAAHGDNTTFVTKEALLATLESADIPKDQARVIAHFFDPKTQMVNTSAVTANPKGREALPKGIGPSNALLAKVVREHTDVETAQVDVFAVFTDDRLLDHRAVVAEMQSGEGSTRPEAQAALFNRWVGYSTAGIMGQYENALDFMRVEGAPSKRALDIYKADAKQTEIEGLQDHLTALTGLATQGTVSEELRAARLAEEETQGLELADPYAQSLGLIATRDIDTNALEGRFNLQDKDYYSMLSKALGLKDAGTTGSATLTRELLTHFDVQDLEEGEVKNTTAAYLLITQGKITWDEYVDLWKSSPEVKAAEAKVMEMLEGITSDKHGMDTVSMRLSGLEEGVTLARFSDQIGEIRTFIENTAQPALTSHQARIQMPVYMIENDNIEGLVANTTRLGSPLIAEMIVQEIAPASEGVERLALLAHIENALADLAVDVNKDAAAAYLKKTVAESKLPKDPVIVEDRVLDAVLGEGEDVFLDVEEEDLVPVGVNAEALLARLGDGQARLARELVAQTSGKEIDALSVEEEQVAALISAQLPLLRGEDTKEAALLEVNRLLQG